ncbi:MAG: VWA domain-containing protein [Aridibacter sp.]
MKKFPIIIILICFASVGIFAQSNRGTVNNDKKANKRADDETSKPKEKPKFANENDIDESAATDDEILNIDTKLVTIPVKVTDRNGRFVGGLMKEDFSVEEDKIGQEIAYFQNEEKPFTVALVLDMSYSTTFKIDEIQQAALTFITQLRPADKVMVVSFDGEFYILCEPTNDRKTIEQAIIKTRIGSGTSLYETVDFVINKRFDKIAGRKAIVLFTDGVDTTSRQANDRDNLRDALELDTLIYPIQYDTFKDVQAIQSKSVIIQPPTIRTTPTANGGSIPTGQPKSPFPFPLPTGTIGTGGGRSGTPPRSMPGSGTSVEDYKKADEYLEEMATRTGGRIYKANSIANLSQAFSNIAGELREFYSLGYYPDDKKETGKQRKIKVRVNRKGVAVRARESYVVKEKLKIKN